jgi:hypothetical protein
VKGSPLLQVRWMLQDAKASLESLGNARWLAFALSIRTELMTSDANLQRHPLMSGLRIPETKSSSGKGHAVCDCRR